MSERPSATPDRYARQLLLPQLGSAGQARLEQGRILIVGCGGLGCTSAELLARAGVGLLRLVDRDVVELTNLHRQLLYDEEDARQGRPKAMAAAARLQAINSTISLEPRVTDVTPWTIRELLQGIDLVVDATDNFETRYLINDACVERQIPWIYGGALGTDGMLLVVRPGAGPCLRCLFPEPPPPAATPRCDTRGVLATVPVIVAALQATEAIKLLLGSPAGRAELTHFEVWQGRWGTLPLDRDPECPACGQRRFDFLAARRTASVNTLHGGGAIQVTPACEAELDLEQLGRTLAVAGSVTINPWFLRFSSEGLELTLFPSGRALVRGATSEAQARAFYVRWIGGSGGMSGQGP